MLHSVQDTALLPATSPAQKSDLFRQPFFVEGGELHIHHDPDSGLQAVVAIDDTTLGPALGGCRYQPYPSTTDAIADALRLARAMTYKSALAGLPYGGGKAVLVHTSEINDRRACFEAFGLFVSTLAGRYITAGDMGTSVTDLDHVARTTPFVLGTSSGAGSRDDSAPATAFGVRRAIEAAARFRLGRGDLEGLRVAIQGLGRNGTALAAEMHAQGCHLIVTDLDQEAVSACVDQFGATPVRPEEILAASCDVLAPCAGGGVLNDLTIARLRAKVIAGCANNQLDQARHGRVLQARRILYAPDYVVNAGGLIHLATSGLCSPAEVRQQIDRIHDTLTEILHQAQREHRAPSEVANDRARSVLETATIKGGSATPVRRTATPC